MAADWDEVAACALALPGTTLGTSYGRPALKVRGKAIAVAGRTEDHFVLMAELDEIDLLIASDPATFFQTEHYRGWPAVLVRYRAADPERIAALIERAWWRRASLRQRAERDTPSA